MRRLVGASILLTGSSLLGLAVNFATQAYLAFRFGTGAEMDAYVAATTLPALLGAVFFSSLSVVFIPAYVEALHQRGADAAWRVASNVLNVTALGLTAAVVVVLAFAGEIMHRIVPGLDPAAIQLSVQLLRWLLPATVLGSLSVVLAGIYQSQERFWPTALAPLFGACILLGLSLALVPSLGIRGVAIASVAGSAAQLLWLSPVLRGARRYRLSLDLRDPALRSIGALALPLIAGGMLYRATIVADRLVASWLPPGSLSHLEYGNRIAVVLNTLFASGIAAALYPRMSARAAASDASRLCDTFVRGQRMLMFFLFPALAVGFALRAPLLQVFFERGEFTARDTAAVAELLPWFLLAVAGGALGMLQGRVYYVLKDTRTPVLLGLAETGTYFLYLPVLARHQGAKGVAMAGAAHLITAMLIGFFVITRKLRPARAQVLLLPAARIAALAAGAGVAAWAAASVPRTALVSLLCGSLAGGLCYLGLLYLVRASEFPFITSLLEAEAEEPASAVTPPALAGGRDEP